MKSRIEAIDSIYKDNPNAFFILSNGLTSRQAAHYLGNKKSFYMLHAMGESLSVGIGLAKTRKDVNVVVIDGDGNAQMGLSSWNCEPPSNLKYYVICNGEHATTGGQLLPKFSIKPSWVNFLSFYDKNTPTPNPPLPHEIISNFTRSLKNEK